MKKKKAKESDLFEAVQDLRDTALNLATVYETSNARMASKHAGRAQAFEEVLELLQDA